MRGVLLTALLLSFALDVLCGKKINEIYEQFIGRSKESELASSPCPSPHGAKSTEFNKLVAFSKAIISSLHSEHDLLDPMLLENVKNSSAEWTRFSNLRVRYKSATSGHADPFTHHWFSRQFCEIVKAFAEKSERNRLFFSQLALNLYYAFRLLPRPDLVGYRTGTESHNDFIKIYGVKNVRTETPFWQGLIDGYTQTLAAAGESLIKDLHSGDLKSMPEDAKVALAIDEFDKGYGNANQPIDEKKRRIREFFTENQFREGSGPFRVQHKIEKRATEAVEPKKLEPPVVDTSSKEWKGAEKALPRVVQPPKQEPVPKQQETSGIMALYEAFMAKPEPSGITCRENQGADQTRVDFLAAIIKSLYLPSQLFDPLYKVNSFSGFEKLTHARISFRSLSNIGPDDPLSMPWLRSAICAIASGHYDIEGRARDKVLSAAAMRVYEAFRETHRPLLTKLYSWSAFCQHYRQMLRLEGHAECKEMSLVREAIDGFFESKLQSDLFAVLKAINVNSIPPEAIPLLAIDAKDNGYSEADSVTKQTRMRGFLMSQDYPETAVELKKIKEALMGKSVPPPSYAPLSPKFVPPPPQEPPKYPIPPPIKVELPQFEAPKSLPPELPLKPKRIEPPPPPPAHFPILPSSTLPSWPVNLPLQPPQQPIGTLPTLSTLAQPIVQPPLVQLPRVQPQPQLQPPLVQPIVQLPLQPQLQPQPLKLKKEKNDDKDVSHLSNRVC